MSTATDMLQKYLTAEQALLEGKEVSLGDRRLRMEDLPAIRAGRQEWEQRVAAETASTSKAQSVGGLAFKLAKFGG